MLYALVPTPILLSCALEVFATAAGPNIYGANNVAIPASLYLVPNLPTGPCAFSSALYLAKSSPINGRSFPSLEVIKSL